MAVLDSHDLDWQPVFEPLAGDRYLRGPHMAVVLPTGAYRMEASGGPGVDRYAFAIGDKEEFTVVEMLHTVAILPWTKRDFFESSPFAAALNLMGLAAAFLLLSVFFIGRMIYRLTRRFRSGS